MGVRLRSLRAERGMTQVALAHALGLSPSYLNQLEQDQRPFTVSVLLKVHKVLNKDRTQTSRVSAVYDAAPRQSFIAALKDVPEVWEIPTTAAPDFPMRRITVAEPIDDFFFDKGYRHLLGASRDGAKAVVASARAQPAARCRSDGASPYWRPRPAMP